MLSYITSGKYAESLSDETARAFERLWTGKADAGVLRGSSAGQKTLMEMFDEDLANRAKAVRENMASVGIKSIMGLSSED